jgi:hypothetical protein
MAEKERLEQKRPSSHSAGKPHRGKYLFSTAIILALIIIGGSLFWRHWANQYSPFPENVKKSVSFPIYYPSSLPKGFFLNTNSLKSSNNLAFYNIDTIDGNKVTVSLQALPKGFDISTSVKPSIKTTVSIPAGIAYNVSTARQTIFIVETADNVLIYLSSSSSINEATMQMLATHLRADQNKF